MALALDLVSNLYHALLLSMSRFHFLHIIFSWLSILSVQLITISSSGTDFPCLTSTLGCLSVRPLPCALLSFLLIPCFNAHPPSPLPSPSHTRLYRSNRSWAGRGIFLHCSLLSRVKRREAPEVPGDFAMNCERTAVARGVRHVPHARTLAPAKGRELRSGPRVRTLPAVMPGRFPPSRLGFRASSRWWAFPRWLPVFCIYKLEGICLVTRPYVCLYKG